MLPAASSLRASCSSAFAAWIFHDIQAEYAGDYKNDQQQKSEAETQQ